EVLSKSLTLRGYINYEFAAEHYPAFLRTVTAAIADGRIRYREDITDGLKNALTAFIGMLEGRNFGKVLVRVTPPTSHGSIFVDDANSHNERLWNGGGW